MKATTLAFWISAILLFFLIPLWNEEKITLRLETEEGITSEDIKNIAHE
ncbi:MAG: hypothetical protein GW815_00590 [Candidatus Moranbacteria bacterium]|nr:hypothetical protein [Candidatus Moranbacteria bacterium]